MAARLVESDIRRVDALIELVADGAAGELDGLYAVAGDEDEGIENYADEVHELDEVSVLFSQLSAVALYSVIEIRTKGALGNHFPGAEIAKAFKFKELLQLFRKATGVALESMPGYDSINELRCLSNSYKHSGTVGDELANFPGWRKGMPLGDVRPAIARIRPNVPAYMKAVTQALGGTGAV